MNPENLKIKIKEILEIVKLCPENLQEKCFEILLSSSLLESPKIIDESTIDKALVVTSQEHFVLPIDVKAFLQQYNIPEEKIQKLFLIHGKEFRSIYKIETIKKAKVQIQLALLVALENALKTSPSKFEFSIENIRQKCIDNKCYDLANFKTHFKNNSNLFKSIEDEEHIELSQDGKQELAETILSVAK
jgi:hypothetical protein